jgi:glutamine cyclotransferase
MKNQTVNMNLLERAELLPRLPQEGSRVTMIVIKDLVEKITFSQDEILKFDIKDVVNGIAWNQAGITYLKAIEFTQLEITTLIATLDKLDTLDKFPRPLLAFYDSLVPKV